MLGVQISVFASVFKIMKIKNIIRITSINNTLMIWKLNEYVKVSVSDL